MSAKKAARISFGDRKHLMTSLQKTDSDDDIVVTSGEIPSNQEEVKGLFDVVKRDFRCSTAAILNRPLYENPETGKNCNRVPIKKLSYVKVGELIKFLVYFVNVSQYTDKNCVAYICKCLYIVL